MLYDLKNFIFDYALWLNIARDHLDRHETMDNYINAKKAICENAQTCFVAHTLYVMLPRYLQRRSTIIPQVVDISYTQFL